MPILGIDVSEHQGWPRGVPLKMLSALAAAGGRFVVARVSVGTKSDKHGRAHIRRIKNRRPTWAIGAYHFLMGGVDGTKQAEEFVRACRNGFGEHSLAGLITVLDVEVSRRESSFNFPNLKDVKAFAKRFDELVPNHRLVIYTNRDTWSTLGNPDASPWFDFLWQAYWTQRADRPPVSLPEAPPRARFGGWGTTPLWQWGPIVLRGHALDGNAFYGSLDDLKELGRSTWVRPPITERPNYRLGYNATAEAVIAALSGVAVPVGPPGVAYHAGSVEAFKDILHMLNELHLTEGET